MTNDFTSISLGNLFVSRIKVDILGLFLEGVWARFVLVLSWLLDLYVVLFIYLQLLCMFVLDQ